MRPYAVYRLLGGAKFVRLSICTMAVELATLQFSVHDVGSREKSSLAVVNSYPSGELACAKVNSSTGAGSQQ